MITESEALRRLVSTCQGFQDAWRQHLNWRDDDGEYNHVSVLAEWIVDQVAAGETGCLPDLFAEVETILDGASDAVHNLIVIGLLEDIQLYAMGKLTPKPKTLDPDVVLGLLGPRSKEAWFDLIAQYWDRFEPGRWRWQRRNPR